MSKRGGRRLMYPGGPLTELAPYECDPLFEVLNVDAGRRIYCMHFPISAIKPGKFIA